MTGRNCPECARLWRDYQTTTTNHVHLTGKRRIAELQYDAPLAAALQGNVEAAEQARDNARRALYRHEAEAHGPTPGSAANVQE